ncbi:MAG: metallopeptidase TldD-related protein, partial [Ectothiorhodospiraceae bacterium]
METNLAIATERLLTPTGLTEDALADVFDRLMGPDVDAADLYFQSSRNESWLLEDGLIKQGGHAIDQGVGVRAVSGEKTGFAYSDEIVMPALLEASGAARAIARAGAGGGVQAWHRGDGRNLYTADDPLASLSDADKVDLLRRVDAEARRQDPRVDQVMVSLSGLHDVVLVADHQGRLSADVRPLVRLNVSVIAAQGDRRESGLAGGGGRHGYGVFLDNDQALGYAREAVRQALVNLEAVPAPAGTMPVVLGPGWPGVLLHEAVGHGLEGDFNRKGTSAFAGRMGEQVASELCTVVDDGTVAGRRGSLNIDDEGTPSSSTVLIDRG